MLQPANLYENELNSLKLNTWYDLNYQYYNYSVFDDLIKVSSSNYDCHQFVSVNSDRKVIGYICYGVDRDSMNVTNLGAISFDMGNPLFGKDLYQAIYDIFEKYHFNRLGFYCYADNPILQTYINLVNKHGGRQSGYLRETTKLMDGKLHDQVLFEILAEDWIR